MTNHAYWTSTATNAKAFEVAKLLVYVSLGFFAAEFIRTFSFDLSILTGKRQRRWPQLAYFGTKYIWVTYIIQNLIVLWAETELKCQIFFDLLEMQMGFVVILSSFLLACRTVCVFQGQARTAITAVLSVFGLGLAAAWMSGVKDVTAVWTPAAATPWNTGACNWDSVKSTYWVKYVVTIVFDLIVLVLTTVGIMRLNGQSRIGDVLLKHGLIYFVLTFAANMTVTILTALQLSPTMALIAAVPQSTVCVICSTRLYIILAEEARPQNGSQPFTSSQLSNNSAAGKVSSLFRSVARKTSDTIPFSSPTKTDFSVKHTTSSTGSSSSSDDLEKAVGQASLVRVEQSREVQVDTLPQFASTHPFGNAAQTANTESNMPSVLEDDEVPADPEVVAQYPRLLGRKSAS